MLVSGDAAAPSVQLMLAPGTSGPDSEKSKSLLAIHWVKLFPTRLILAGWFAVTEI